MNPGTLGRDAARLVRERPVVVVGAGVAVLLAARFLSRDPGDDAAAAAAAPADPWAGGTLGPLGSLGPTYAPPDFSVPWLGDLPVSLPPLPSLPGWIPTPTPLDPTTPSSPVAPPAPAPSSPSAPAQWWPAWLGTPPASAIGALRIAAGTTYRTFRVSGSTAYRVADQRTAGGFSAYFDREGVFTFSGGGTVTIARLITGMHSGLWVGTKIAGATVYRKP